MIDFLLLLLLFVWQDSGHIFKVTQFIQKQVTEVSLVSDKYINMFYDVSVGIRASGTSDEFTHSSSTIQQFANRKIVFAQYVGTLWLMCIKIGIQEHHKDYNIFDYKIMQSKVKLLWTWIFSKNLKIDQIIVKKFYVEAFTNYLYFVVTNARPIKFSSPSWKKAKQE